MKISLTPKRIKLVAAAVLSVAAVCAGFFLPSAVMRIQDARSEYVTGTAELDDVALSSSRLIERLSLVQNYDSSIDVEGGRGFSDGNEALDRAIDELGALNALFESYGAEAFALDQKMRSKSRAMLNANGKNGSSAVLWELQITTGDDQLYVIVLDDETGVILGLSRLSSSFSASAFEADSSAQTDMERESGSRAMSAANAFADYLSLELQEISAKYEGSDGGLYFFSLSDGRETAELTLMMSGDQCIIN